MLILGKRSEETKRRITLSRIQRVTKRFEVKQIRFEKKIKDKRKVFSNFQIVKTTKR